MAPACTIVLMRHGPVAPQAGLVRRAWPLSHAGRIAVATSAASLVPLGIEWVAASPERRARETADLVADALDVPVTVLEDLCEHRRDAAPVMPEAVYREAVEAALRQPDLRVFGEESITEAVDRFVAVLEAIARQGSGPVLVVSHGTVMAACLARLHNEEPISLWRSLEPLATVTIAL